LNIERYFERIGITNEFSLTNDSLFTLHKQHIFHVPFENLDIHLNRPLSLNVQDLFYKIVLKNQGGFCYELNFLFSGLLIQLGFKAKIIECRIFDNNGNPGPRFDHMAIIVSTDKDWLVDVGFGDLFITPLEIMEENIQFDNRNYFRIRKKGAGDYILSMSADNNTYLDKYIFTTKACSISDFFEICKDKQINPQSYFVKNLVCTKPTDKGRITIFNKKLIIKNEGKVREGLILNTKKLNRHLRKYFGIQFLIPESNVEYT
jgi:N-hydroxyarylamine O-acetyltransferase